MDNHEIEYTAKEAMQSIVEYLKDKTERATLVITIRTISEKEKNIFIKMFGHWLHKNRERVFLLAANAASLQIMKQRIEAAHKGIKIVETATWEEHGVSDDMVLNRINGAEADCIIACLPQEIEEAFIKRNRMSLNAKVWLGLGSKRDWQQEKSWKNKLKELVSGATQKTNKE